MAKKSKRIGWYKTKAIGIIGFDKINDRFILTGKVWEKGDGPPGMKFDRKPSKTGDTTIFINFDRALLRSLVGKAVIFTEEAKRWGDYVENTVRIQTVR